jgi:hypothetical protein
MELGLSYARFSQDGSSIMPSISADEMKCLNLISVSPQEVSTVVRAVLRRNQAQLH